MKTLYVLLLVMGITIVFIKMGYAQKQFADKFESQLEAGGKLLRSGYHFTFEKVDKQTFVFKQYYPDTRQMTHLITYQDKQQSTLQGPYNEWWDDGSLRYQGQFESGERSGEWTESRGRNTYGKGTYTKGKKEGTWTYTDQKGRTNSTVNYVDGLTEGACIYYDTLGQVTKKDLYRAGEFIETLFSAKVQDTLKTDEDAYVVEEMPRFPGCESVEDAEARKQCASRAMLEYLYRQIKYPERARREGIEGTAVVSFVVNKEGLVEEVEVRRGLCVEIKKEVERLVQQMPRWRPGIQGGEPVRVYFTLPVKFKLE